MTMPVAPPIDMATPRVIRRKGVGRVLAENVRDGVRRRDQAAVTRHPRISVARAAAMTVFLWARTLT